MLRIWSKNDLGTCRRYDLFCTTPTNMPIEEFQVVDFSVERTQEMEDLEEFYNNGVVTEEMIKEISNSEKLKESTSLVDSVNEAFGNQQERRARLASVSFSDLI